MIFGYLFLFIFLILSCSSIKIDGKDIERLRISAILEESDSNVILSVQESTEDDHGNELNQPSDTDQGFQTVTISRCLSS